MLSKNELARELENRGVGRATQIKNILDAMADVAAEQVGAGEGFTVPGIVRIDWRYTKPLARGEKYVKGETYVGFGGAEVTAEADSKPRKASVKLAATVAAPIKRTAPNKDGMSRFMQSRVGRAIAARKG